MKRLVNGMKGAECLYTCIIPSLCTRGFWSILNL